MIVAPSMTLPVASGETTVRLAADDPTLATLDALKLALGLVEEFDPHLGKLRRRHRFGPLPSL